MSRGPFEKRVVIWLASIAGVSLLAFLTLMFFGSDLSEVQSAGSDAYSSSAVGHKAFVDLLTRLGVKVTLSRFKSAGKARGMAVLIIAEPTMAGISGEAGEKLRKMIELADRTILILPKRRASEDPDRPGWIINAKMVLKETVEGVMTAAGIDGDLIRVGVDDLAPVFRGGTMEGTPGLSEAQLIRSTEMTPLVTSARGILVGEITSSGSRRLIVISDPDLVSTHGMADGDNAVIATTVVFDLLGDDRTVTVDETLHGYELPPNIWGSLLVFPLSLATAQVLLILAIVVWAAVGRFGAPLPVNLAPEHGKEVLIGNTADLLVYGGHTSKVLKRYFTTTVLDLARAFSAPAGLSRTEAVKWVAALGKKRGATLDLLAIGAEVREAGTAGKSADSLSGTAMKIHRYKKEILHGS